VLPGARPGAAFLRQVFAGLGVPGRVTLAAVVVHHLIE
jgi:hypothetical protein